MAPPNRQPAPTPRSRTASLVLALGLLALIGIGLYAAGRQLWAEYHRRQAEQALARRDFASARTHLATCLSVWPESAEVRLLAARLARRAGDQDEAAAQLKAYERLGGLPELVDLERRLSRAQRGDMAGNEGFLLAAVKSGHPDAVLILEALAQGYLATYRLEQARHCLDLWLEREPDAPQAFAWRGEVAERSRLTAEAAPDYRRALEIDPDRDATRLALARLLLNANQPDEALAHFEYLLQRQPGNPAARVGLARCYAGVGRTDEARVLLDAVLAVQPRHAEALTERARLAQQQSGPAAAEEYLRRAEAAAPHDRDVIYNLYLCLEQLGKREEASTYAARLKKIEAGLDRLGELTHKVAESPRDPALRCEAGKIFLENGQEQEGLRWLLSALREDPSHEPTHLALAEFYERTGRPDLAAAHRRRTTRSR